MYNYLMSNQNATVYVANELVDNKLVVYLDNNIDYINIKGGYCTVRSMFERAKHYRCDKIILRSENLEREVELCCSTL